MSASTIMGSKMVAPQRISAPRHAAAPVSATLRSDVARFAKAAGVSVVSFALVLSAQAAEVKLGLDNGNLVREIFVSMTTNAICGLADSLSTEYDSTRFVARSRFVSSCVITGKCRRIHYTCGKFHRYTIAQIVTDDDV